MAILPYGRIYWRFPMVTECLVHRRPLLDQCRVCGAGRDRASKRWERFDCGHHVQRSAGGESRPVDLRVQQVIQAALGVGDGRPGEGSAWILNAAIEQKGRLVEVQVARETLRGLWTEHRNARAIWHRPSRMLRALEQRGERMYPTERAPLLATSQPEPTLSVEVLRQTMEQVVREFSERSVSARTRAAAKTASVAIGTPAAL